MEFAPDGRIFVAEQGGNLRVIKNGSLLSTPFLHVDVDSTGERGLLGVAFDPDFASNRFVYVYYTTASSPIHNRVSRFTANGDVAVTGSESVLLELNDLSGATNHNGGAIHFGRGRRSLHRRGRQRGRHQRAKPEHSARKTAAHSQGWYDSERQSIFQYGHGPQSSHLGARIEESLHICRAAGVDEFLSTTWGKSRGKRSTME